MYDPLDQTEAYAHLFSAEHTAGAYYDSILDSEEDLERLTDAALYQVEKKDPDVATFIRLVRNHAGCAIRIFQRYLGVVGIWLTNQRHEQQRKANDLEMRLAQAEFRHDTAGIAREEAVQRRNAGVVECGLSFVPGNGPQHLEEALVRKMPPLEAATTGIAPYDPASPPPKSPTDILWTGLAPVTTGSLAGICMADILGFPVYTQLMRGEVSALLLATIACGIILVFQLGKIGENMLRSLLITEETQTSQFPHLWVKEVNRLQGFLVCTIVAGEVVLETFGLQSLHAKRIEEAARFGASSVTPLPLWVYLIIASVVSLPYLVFKFSRVKSELENEVRWNALAAFFYEWEQKERTSASYQKAYLASLEILHETEKEQKANTAIATLKAEYQKINQEPILPEHLQKGLQAAAATVRGEKRQVFALLEAELHKKKGASFYGPASKRPFSAHSTGVRPSASSAFRSSRDRVARAWSGLKAFFQSGRSGPDEAATQADGVTDI